MKNRQQLRRPLGWQSRVIEFQGCLSDQVHLAVLEFYDTVAPSSRCQAYLVQ